jgi:hypothetical protein
MGFASFAIAEKPQWPVNVRRIGIRLVPAFVRSKRMPLPQLRMYDAQGRLLWGEVGYRPAFDVSLAEIFEGRAKPDAAYPLSDELARVMTARAAKKAAAVASEADFTLVKYWAEWCVPCHAQSRDLVNLFAAYADVRFALIEVDAGGVRRGP